MNVKLLRKVAKYILAEPKRLAMYLWLRHKDYPEEMLDTGFAAARPFAKTAQVAAARIEHFIKTKGKE